MNCSFNDELRIALIEGSRLYDLDSDSDSKSLLKGSIFKAKVSRIESSLDAAFVDFGSERHGFLPLKELTESFFSKDHSGKKSCNLKDGDEIIIDAVKGEINVTLTDDEITRRKKDWKPRTTNHNSGSIWKYAQTVGPAHEAAVTQPGAKEETHTYADI